MAKKIWDEDPLHIKTECKVFPKNKNNPILIKSEEITIKFDYPLKRAAFKDFSNKDGFTITDIMKNIYRAIQKSIKKKMLSIRQN